MRSTRFLATFAAAVSMSACASASSSPANGAQPSAAPVNSTALGPAPACTGTLMIEIENPSPYEVYATLWMADRTQRHFDDRIESHDTRRFPVPAGTTPIAVTAKGRGFDMTRMGGESPSAVMGGDIKVPARWVCVAK